MAEAERIWGLIAEFDRAEALVAAAAALRREGYRRLDAHTPFPVEELTEAIGFRDNAVPWLTLAGGILGAAGGFGMQVLTNLDYPIIIGGRPLIAPQAFALITFELMVLFAVFGAIVGMLALNRLPRLNHPVFDDPRFHLATRNRFFVVVESADPLFHPRETRAALERLGPSRVAPLPPEGEP